MKRQNGIKRYKDRVTAVFLTLTGGLIIITPLCGLLFQCHCDWPWLNSYFECNYFDSEMSHKCPWCKSELAGIGSILMASILATVASLFLTPNIFALATATMTARVGYGLAVFILIAVMAGVLAAYIQHYPLGIGDLYITKEAAINHEMFWM